MLCYALPCPVQSNPILYNINHSGHVIITKCKSYEDEFHMFDFQSISD